MSSSPSANLTTTDPPPSSSTTIPTPAEHFSSIAKNYERMTSGATLVIAKHLLETTEPKLTSSSHVLDNACGTGIVTREILDSFLSSSSTNDTTSKQIPHISAADISSSMTSVLSHTIETKYNNNNTLSHQLDTKTRVDVRVESAESLTYADETFTHSYTNFGLLFFNDAPRAAAHIYRTLKSNGGVAYVTTWQDLGYYEAWESACAEILGLDKEGKDVVVQRPGVAEKWKDAGILEETMKEAGFTDVRVYQRPSWRKEQSVRDMGESIAISVEWATRSWTEEQKNKLPGVVMRYMMEDRERCFVDEETGGVTVLMVAHVAVCRK